MIESFKHKGLKRLYEKGDRSKVQADLADEVENMLFAIDVAEDISELNLPSYNLHALKGELKDYWSITVRSNWRIIFRFKDGRASDVELIDYH